MGAARQLLRALAAVGGQAQLKAAHDPHQSAAFARAMAELVSGVCVVTASGPHREPHGLVATSLCSYSADPPAVLLCIARTGRARAAVASAPAFGVHVLSDEHEHVARRFASDGIAKFATVNWAWDAGVPSLAPDHAIVYLRCRRAAVKCHGDHAIVIGNVERVALRSAGDPLVYFRRRMDWRLQTSNSL